MRYEKSNYGVRKYGEPPYRIAMLHGGPGAPGGMASVAREISAESGVLEPLQSEDSLFGQIAELKRQLEANADPPVVLIGSSWGAMLAYLFAAHHSEAVMKIVMVGSGVYEEKWAEGIMNTRLSRLNAEDRTRAELLLNSLSSPANKNADHLMQEFGASLAKTDAFDPVEQESDVIEIQSDVHRKVWADAVALRKSGELLKLGKRVLCPVVAIHGDYDPHPADGVREPLSKVLSDFRFILLERCGHEPWLEKQAGKRFYELLRNEVFEDGLLERKREKC